MCPSSPPPLPRALACVSRLREKRFARRLRAQRRRREGQGIARRSGKAEEVRPPRGQAAGVEITAETRRGLPRSAPPASLPRTSSIARRRLPLKRTRALLLVSPASRRQLPRPRFHLRADVCLPIGGPASPGLPLVRTRSQAGGNDAAHPAEPGRHPVGHRVR